MTEGDHAAYPLQTVGRWRLDRHLGSGYFGHTYRAVDRLGHLADPIALKIVGPFTDGALEEVRRATRLNHPAIVRYFVSEEHDVRTSSGARRCLVVPMELCDASLDDLLRDLPDVGVSAEQVAADLVPVLIDGLRHLHGLGVVHQDLHSGNVFLQSGHWKIGDLGQAREIGPDGRCRSWVGGTPWFVAPEVGSRRVRSHPGTDVYALGVLAHLILVGRHLHAPPEDGDWVEHLATVVPRISSRLPASWCRFVERCAAAMHERADLDELQALVPRLSRSERVQVRRQLERFGATRRRTLWGDAAVPGARLVKTSSMGKLLEVRLDEDGRAFEHLLFDENVRTEGRWSVDGSTLVLEFAGYELRLDHRDGRGVGRGLETNHHRPADDPVPFAVAVLGNSPVDLSVSGGPGRWLKALDNGQTFVVEADGHGKIHEQALFGDGSRWRCHWQGERRGDERHGRLHVGRYVLHVQWLRKAARWAGDEIEEPSTQPHSRGQLLPLGDW